MQTTKQANNWAEQGAKAVFAPFLPWNPFGTPDGASTYWNPELAEKNYREFGKHLAGGTTAGIAAGIGIGGLYQLTKYLRNRARAATAKPPIESLVYAPPTEDDLADQNKQANALLLPALGAGAGALIGATRNKAKGKRLSAALRGAALGGAGGAVGSALTSEPAMTAISRTLGGAQMQYFNPLFALPALFGGSSGVPAKGPSHAVAMGLAGTLLPAAGVYGGLKLVNSLAKSDNSQENRDAIVDARKEYFSALTGPKKKTQTDEEAEKTAAALDSELNALFDNVIAERREKRGFETPQFLKDIGTSARNLWHNIYDGGSSIGGFPIQVALGLGAMGGLGGAAIGAHHMYNKTKAKSEARALARARAARERMRGLDAPWVDPVELAEIKRMATGVPGM